MATRKPSKSSKPVRTPGVVVMNPAASKLPTTPPAAFSPSPYHQRDLVARPLQTPKSRQLAEGEHVKILNRVDYSR